MDRDELLFRRISCQSEIVHFKPRAPSIRIGKFVNDMEFLNVQAGIIILDQVLDSGCLLNA